MFRAPRVKVGVAALAIGLVATLSACGTSDPTSADPAVASGGKIVVGSFNFPESEILGNIYLLALQAKGIDATSKFDIGARQQTIPALQDGSINLIPEYNGNLLAYYNPKYTQRTTSEVDQALPAVLEKDKLRVLDAAPAEDKDAYVVTSKTASADGLTSIGDLSKIVPFKLGANPQFGTLGYGIPGLQSVYGVGTSKGDVDFVPIEDYGGPDTVKALTDNSVQVADIYTTSPAITSDHLVVLQDPKNMISSQNVIPLISDAAYSSKIADVLNAVSAKLTTSQLIALRAEVEGGDKISAATAAKNWLQQNGLD